MHGPWRGNMNFSCLFCIFYSLSFVHSLSLCLRGPFSQSLSGSELTRGPARAKRDGYMMHNRQYMWEHTGKWDSNSKIPRMKESLLICSCALNIQYKIDGSLSSIMQSGLWAISHYTSVFSWPTSAFAVIIPSRANYRECVYNSSVS